ncbi:ElyC/SanA/YdcF family protein [Microbacterium sp. SSW1-59]|uniref:ElyC/SanA/YdcF family protein n=1 Tax=Microbacterium xanthum TaxID=3079794 RepID=UPI002AD2FC75|nr:ElyC/SanA/YdcF family protein [Microbacterium sp. SSW1-59]MDZ8202152.1 ElyC/SanA/YdcF family protein [Microbacterium sp. SSW1-59]
MPRRRRCLAAAALLAVGAAVAVAVAAEVYDALASRRGVPALPARAPTREAVVVLGYGNRGSRANAVNRYRVRAGIRSIDPRAVHSTLILSGGPVHSAEPEARIMARYARRRGYRGPMRLEAESLSTRDNIRHVIPLLEDADVIVLVSNPPHAEMARDELRRVRPDLALRLRRAADHRFGEVLPFKVVGALVSIRHHRRLPPA